jgi:hypothetical protein
MSKALPGIVVLALALPVPTACRSNSATDDNAAMMDTAREQQIRQLMADQQRAEATRRVLTTPTPLR